MSVLKYLPLVLVLLLAGCRSTKTATDGTDGARRITTAETYVRKVTDTRSAAPALTARIKMALNMSGRDLSVNGSLKMKRDDVVQLSLTFLGMEVGRLEFTKDSVLIIDRYNKQYVRSAYKEVDFLNRAGLDFTAVQALFWNELFAPGHSQAPLAQRFSLSDDGRHTMLTLSDSTRLNYTFRTLSRSGRIEQVSVSDGRNKQRGTFTCDYSAFIDFEGKPFPSCYKMTLGGLGRMAGFTLELNRMSNDSSWPSRTGVSAKYKERKASDVLRKLLSK